MGVQQRILVVDDNEAVCATLAELLVDEGYAVTSVTDGASAYTELARHEYHLLLLDIVLPDTSGIDILRMVRDNWPETDAIMMTSNASLESATEALRLGAKDYLHKPFESLDMVLRVVNRAIEKRCLIEENAGLYQQILNKTAKLEQAVNRLTLLNEISNALHSMHDLKELLQLLVQSIAQELGAERASLMLVDHDQRSLTIEAFVGIEQNVAESVRVPIGHGISGWVAQEGRTLFSEDISQDSRFVKQTERPYHSDSFISAPLVLSVPILLKREVIGVINLNNKIGGGSFTDEDTQLVTTVAGQIAISIENARMIDKLRHTNRELKDTHFQIIATLAEALEAKDAVTGSHSERLLRFAMRVADNLGLDEHDKELLRYAAVLHDIGKIGIPESILQKPGVLTHDEYEQIKQHPRIGAELIRTVKFLSAVAPIIQAHHEWYDGSGYPYSLAGEQIPIQARIVAALDAFDAMTSERPYRVSLGREWAIQELRSFAGRQFDPQVVDALLAVIDEE